MENFDLRDELKKKTNALTVLAELPLPVYITTNCDDFMLQALKFEGKRPQLEVCDWNNLVSNKYPSVLKDYSPSKDEPVVFHFHGHKDMAQSLVLTEDDYYDFLVHVSEFKETVPPRIQRALANSSLLFVGYSLADVDFRVVLRASLIKTMPSSQYSNVGIQLPPPEGAAAQAYLDRYFEKVKVKVYWGDAIEFVTELKRRWDVKNFGKRSK